MNRITGYEFQIRERGPARQPNRWVRLMGSGGCYGDSALHIENPEKSVVEQIINSLLGRTRRVLRDGGELREWVDHEDHRLRIRPLEVLHVLQCRPIYVQESVKKPRSI